MYYTTIATDVDTHVKECNNYTLLQRFCNTERDGNHMWFVVNKGKLFHHSIILKPEFIVFPVQEPPYHLKPSSYWWSNCIPYSHRELYQALCREKE